MLDVRTRQRIDTARDILVGKVPDPKSQVEQITLALMYKFMGDMDAQSEEYGGKATFFAGDFARYSWRKIVGRGIGAYDALNLYSEGMTRMGENPGLPALFRSMFNNAYLPFRDPETLKGFLQVIDEFEYDNSERLGDAFEYLLSIMGSQGDAGQFRTPRHIIDFIVEIVDPKKDERILDPACGTAGFLISAYKHIGKTNEDVETPLTSAERTRLAENVRGYDISPDMVRLSLVNLYLHGFPEPDIFEYDTLTSEERWGEYANVILANPPFMSPKGGIRPHNLFSVTSKRSEVLFVDYIAEHLTPDGRAGVIVPEGIIFQSQNAHTQLRKMLVNEYLVAVVSLPPGVFNPYSGVKTSILILDKSLARRADTIGFFKVENDGFDLGAQRRPVDRNDLPRVKAEVAEYLRRLREGDGVEEYAPENGLVVEKERIGADGEFNLGGERYRVVVKTDSAWPKVALAEVADIFNGVTSKKSEYRNHGTVKVIKVKDFDETDVYFDKNERGWIDHEINTPKYLKIGDTLMINAAHNASHVAAKIGFLNSEPPFKSLPSGEVTIFRAKERILPLFLNRIVTSDVIRAEFRNIVKGIHIYPKDIQRIQIPLPPLDTQREIVSEIEGYQKVIDGARAVVENWRPRIAVDPEWSVVELGEIFGRSDKTVHPNEIDGPVNYIGLQNITGFSGEIEGDIVLEDPAEVKSLKNTFGAGDILYGKLRPNLNKVWQSDTDGICSTDIFVLRPVSSEVDINFFTYFMRSEHFNNAVVMKVAGAQLPRIDWPSFRHLPIPLPPLVAQQAIAVEIQAERELVDANRRLIDRMKGRVREVVGRVWGDAETDAL